MLQSLTGNEAPQLLNVDTRGHVSVLSEAEVSHTTLTEVTRMVLVEVDSVVMLTTGITVTTWMLTVLTDTTMTGRDVT